MNNHDYAITHSEDYRYYIQSLCWLSSGYVSKIRVKFAEKAYEMYQNETIRKLVIEYGHEYEKLQNSRLADFSYCAEYGAVTSGSLEDSCLNHSREYAQTIKFFFGI